MIQSRFFSNSNCFKYRFSVEVGIKGWFRTKTDINQGPYGSNRTRGEEKASNECYFRSKIKNTYSSRYSFLVQIFLSHSRKDEDLIEKLKAGLGVMNYQPIVYEDLAESVNIPDYQRIRTLIQGSDVVFLFLTNNVASSKWTTYWVDHEVSQAAAFNKPLVMFQVEGEEPPLPIGYCTDVVTISRDPTLALLNVQQIAKRFEKKSLWPIGAIGGAAVGSILGPIGSIFGALIGAAVTSGSGQAIIQTVLCSNDQMRYRYLGAPGSSFFCPHCLTEYIYSGEEDEH